MKALVTGGAGFIGSHLSELLIAGGHEVIIVDNLISGRVENLKSISSSPRFKFVNMDICDISSILPLFAGVDWVFHLAGLADIVPSIEMPSQYYSVNVSGTFNVLECARQCGIKRFVYAASSSCYGIPDIYPTPEAAAIRPQYPYALTKYMGEELVLHWSSVYKLQALSLRLFNVYGPRSRTSGAYGAVFGVFLAQKLGGQPFTVVGDGNQTRDFTYVTDVAEAFLRTIESNISGEAMNVGSGNCYSINRLVGLLGGNVKFIPKRPGEPDCTFADVSKIEGLIGWKARVSFEDGVRQMLMRIDDWKDAPIWDPTTILQATATWFHYLGEEKKCN
ncbi:MAG: SDR family oxidoreductase [Syntrophobacteraceae bacterium]